MQIERAIEFNKSIQQKVTELNRLAQEARADGLIVELSVVEMSSCMEQPYHVVSVKTLVNPNDLE